MDLEHKRNADTGPAGADNTGNHSAGERPVSRVRPIPEAYRNIQVNFCKTPGCPNLCVQPLLGRIRTGRSNESDGYRVSGARTESALLCTYCGVESRIKSNQAIHEEFQRQAAHIFAPSPLVCPQGCQSDPRHPTKAFQRFGKSGAGSLRFRCRSCKATFSIPGPTTRQRRTRANAPVFRHLVNKVPLNRIVELCGVSFPTLYDKIRFTHRQCSLFAASREARLPDMNLGRRFLCTDRQDYIVNWGSRTSRRTIQLTAVATADRESGYLFAFSPNFDEALDQDQAEAAWLAAGDAAKPPQMRDTARIWTKADYEQSLARAAAKKLPKPAGRKGDEVTVALEQREDLDAAEPMVEGQQLPSRGVQVHADYLMHGHYHHLRHLLRGTSQLNFSLDEDSGLLAACMGAFSDRVRDHTAEVVQVRIAKELSIDDRRREIVDTRKTFAAAVAALRKPVRLKEDGFDDQRAATAVVAEDIGRLRAASPDPERKLQRVWVKNPAPDAAEPRKFWRYVSDDGHLYDHDVAFLLRMSTLWPVDKVFAMLRRRVSMFERPVSSVRRARRLWQIYAAYDPRMVVQMLEIFRVWHNWLWRGGDGMTAAERLGLTMGTVREDHILGYDIREVVERFWATMAAAEGGNVDV
jgi:transposase-like protein